MSQVTKVGGLKWTGECSFRQASRAFSPTIAAALAHVLPPPHYSVAEWRKPPGDKLGIRLLEPPEGLDYLIHGYPTWEAPVQLKGDSPVEHSKYNAIFGVKAGVSFYDDSGAPNARAYPGAIFPDGPRRHCALGHNSFPRREEPSG